MPVWVRFLFPFCSLIFGHTRLLRPVCRTVGRHVPLTGGCVMEGLWSLECGMGFSVFLPYGRVLEGRSLLRLFRLVLHLAGFVPR